MPSVQISKSLVIINSAGSIVTRSLALIVYIWLQQHLLRRISPEEYSLLPVVSALMVFAPLVSTILTGGVVRYSLAAAAKNDAERLAQICSTMFFVLVAGGLVVLAGGAVLAWNIDKVLVLSAERIGQARVMFALMVFCFALRLPLAPLSVGFEIRQKYILRNGIELGAQLLSIVVLVTLLFGVSTRVIWVVVSSTVMQLTEMSLRVIWSRRLVPELRIRLSAFRGSLVRTLVSFGAWNFVGQIGTVIRMAADPIILNRLATPVAVASFHIGAMPDRHLRTFITEGSSPLYPALTAMHEMGENERLRRAFLRMTRILMWVVMLVVASLLVYRRELFSLYLRERYSTYTEATVVMLLLLGGYPFLLTAGGLVKIAAAKARIRAFMIVTLVTQLSNLALTLYLVGHLHMGATGSALSTFLTTSFACLLGHGPLGFRLLGLRFRDFLREALVRGLVPVAVAACVWSALRQWVVPSGWLALGLCFGIGLCVYTASLYICLAQEDRNDLRRVLRKLGVIGKRAGGQLVRGED